MASLEQGQGEGGDDGEAGPRACVLLPEESVCLKIADTTEAWLVKTKRIMQGNSFTSSEIAKGTQLDLILDLFREGCSIPLNLEYEMRPLRVALRDTGAWLKEHAVLLGLLGVAPTAATAVAAGSDSGSTNRASSSSSSSSSSSNSDNRSVSKSTEPGGEGDKVRDVEGAEAEAAMSVSVSVSEPASDSNGSTNSSGSGNDDGSGNGSGDGVTDEAPAESVTYADLQRCVASGSGLSADFMELR